MRWFRRLLGRPELDDLERATELAEARARYAASLGQLRATTEQLRERRSRSLDEVQRRVQNADVLMREAFRKRMPSSG